MVTPDDGGRMAIDQDADRWRAGETVLADCARRKQRMNAPGLVRHLRNPQVKHRARQRERRRPVNSVGRLQQGQHRIERIAHCRIEIGSEVKGDQASRGRCVHLAIVGTFSPGNVCGSRCPEAFSERTTIVSPGQRSGPLPDRGRTRSPSSMAPDRAGDESPGLPPATRTLSRRIAQDIRHRWPARYHWVMAVRHREHGHLARQHPVRGAEHPAAWMPRTRWPRPAGRASRRSCSVAR
jgi:hypothetical protein